MSKIAHPESDNAADWSAADVEDFADSVLEDDTFQELQAEANEEYGRLSEDEEAALEALAEPEEEETATVQLREDVKIDVKTYLSGDMENRLDRIADNADNLPVVREDIVTAMAWLIVDEEYGQERLWRAYADDYGLTSLGPLFFRAVKPAMDKVENDQVVQEFRAKQ